MTQPKPALHFSHANGFPAGCYREMLGQLEPRYEIGYIDTLGHNPRFPVTDCWPNLVAETLDYIEKNYDEPVIAVGHSLGGFLSFLSALQKPDYFKAIVLLDSPIFSRRTSLALKTAKLFGLIERITPGNGTRKRRRDWEDHEAAFRYFRDKKAFAEFTDASLRAYVEAGTIPHAEGVRLRFDPEVEYQIYCGLPHIFPRYRGTLKVPTGFIGGARSAYVHPSDITQMREHFGIVIDSLDAGHLFPFEQPVQAAERIEAMIARLTG
ncbi:alpha/beta fold hydrolase [Chitinimonas sp. BJYL2]|uniref:alpha/beta fold hydrolase n=1 Tax=Chitinimonas sp. BJYL2 TaxID=2976696 RepID=UPI0022B58444|nr:alpha/beta hydrolase [Chitinimonas sp. BJYL2]